MDIIKERWNEIIETVRKEYGLTDISFKTWIQPLNEYCVKDDIVYILIPNEKANVADYISSKYKEFF